MTLKNAFGDLSTEAKQDTAISILGDLLTELTNKLEEGQQIITRHVTADGNWSYKSGSSGTPTINGRVIGITATGGENSGSFTINGGDTVIIPPNMSIDIAPRGNLLSPNIEFVDTAFYFVELVT